VLAALEGQYGKFEIRSGSTIDQILWAILSKEGSADKAARAVAALWRTFVDANELRVAQTTQIAELIQDCCGAKSLEVGDRIRAILKALFKDNNALAFAFGKEMDRESLRKYLTGLPGFGPELVLSVLLKLAPGENDLVADPHAARVAVRTKITTSSTTAARFRKFLEEEVTDPQERLRTLYTLSAHGGAVCRARAPACGECALGKWCPSYVAPKETAASSNPARRGGKSSTPRTTRARKAATGARKSSRR